MKLYNKTINHTKRVGDEFPILKEKKLKETHILKLVELFPFHNV